MSFYTTHQSFVTTQHPMLDEFPKIRNLVNEMRYGWNRYILYEVFREMRNRWKVLPPSSHVLAFELGIYVVMWMINKHEVNMNFAEYMFCYQKRPKQKNKFILVSTHSIVHLHI